MTLIGTVTQYLDQIDVAIIELTDTLNLGDVVVIKYGDEEFEQTVESIQIDEDNMETAQAGDIVGVHVDHHTHPGAEVFKK